MLANGDNKPLWLTEFGWSTTSLAGVGVSEATQAAYLTLAMQCVEQDPYVEVAIWSIYRNRVHDSNTWLAQLGLVRTDFSTKPAYDAFKSYTPGKNFVETGAFGPWMVTADELPPNSVMSLTTRLNGQVMQKATTEMLIFSMPRLIAYCSTFVPLAIGDVIVTGTPGGVGARRNPPVFMKPGDVVEVEVDRIGTLRNVVAVG